MGPLLELISKLWALSTLSLTRLSSQTSSNSSSSNSSSSSCSSRTRCLRPSNKTRWRLHLYSNSSKLCLVKFNNKYLMPIITTTITITKDLPMLKLTQTINNSNSLCQIWTSWLLICLRISWTKLTGTSLTKMILSVWLRSRVPNNNKFKVNHNNSNRITRMLCQKMLIYLILNRTRHQSFKLMKLCNHQWLNLSINKTHLQQTQSLTKKKFNSRLPPLLLLTTTRPRSL